MKLPPFFQRQNENEVAVNILVVQGAVTTMIALLYALVPSVSSAYWILSVMTTQVYLVVYLLMFIARATCATSPRSSAATRPRCSGSCASWGSWPRLGDPDGSCQPSQFESGNSVAYIGVILAGTGLIGLLPPYLFLRARKPSWKSAEPEVTS